jgi:putative ABC transport system substrate-binding protein
MALWRGMEPCAQGFQDYFYNQNIPVKFIVRDADQNKEKLTEFIKEVNETNPDLVFTWGTTVTETMLGRYDDQTPEKRINSKIPAVFAIVTQPVGGVTPNLNSTGRNITGTLYLVPVDVQMKLLNKYRQVKKLGYVYNPVERNSWVVLGELRAIAAQQGFEIIERPIEVRDGKPLVESIEEKIILAKGQGADWLYIPPDTFMNVNRNVITEAALKLGLPTFAAAENPVVYSKGLIGVIYRYYSVGQLTASKAAEILVNGTKPISMPIGAPMRLSVVINMDTAKELRLYPPMSILNAAEVIDSNNKREIENPPSK